MTATLIVCLWLLFSPLGYVLIRRANRAMCSRWTRNDRLFGIMFSVFYGPMMLVIAAIVFLCYRLDRSDWGNQDARW